MSEETKEIALSQHEKGAFSGIVAFEGAQRMAHALTSSTMVPADYRGKQNLGNALIALEMAQRIGASPMAVMQNLHIIQGRPSWSSSFIVGALNSCGRFSPLRFETEDLGEKSVEYEYYVGKGQDRQKKKATEKIKDMRCVAWAYDKQGGERLIGPAVTIEMAVKEGWYTKRDSKWKTMPELMIMYRSAAFFGRLYAPDILMGMHSDDEVVDIGVAKEVAVPEVVKPATEEDTAETKEPEAVEVEAAEEPGPEESEPEEEHKIGGSSSDDEPEPEPQDGPEEKDAPPLSEPDQEMDLF